MQPLRDLHRKRPFFREGESWFVFSTATLPPGESGATVGVSAASPSAYTEEAKLNSISFYNSFSAMVSFDDTGRTD